MTDYFTSAITTADTAVNAAGGTTTNNDMDSISVSKDGAEDNSKDEASDDDEGTEEVLFCAARDILNTQLMWLSG